MFNLIIPTLMMLTLVKLTLPIFSGATDKTDFKYWNAVHMAFLLSLIPTLMTAYWNIDYSFSLTPWMSYLSFNSPISLKIDLYSTIFTSAALYVTWSILEFASWYMHQDPKKQVFFKYLLVFLLAMIILVTSNNLLQLFIGWEGVGVMSFLLISWWYGRAAANTASLQAIIYNRLGDVGLIIVLIWFAINLNSWEFSQIFMLAKNTDLTVPMIGLIVAAMGKSAQFTLHPWLPSAMEGPTPVSALLHSSTMVVAGIFLLIRLHPLMQHNKTLLSACLLVGALTTLYAASCAILQNDIKKVVAFSTSSQLGLMMVAIGLNFPNLAFFHLCTHAMFKAMLFICSGFIIHALNNEQDIRKMSGLSNILPSTTSYFVLGNLALMGTPFLAGFFSKDALIEAMVSSNLNLWALLMTLAATSFTSVYTIRMMYLVLTPYTRFNQIQTVTEAHSPLNTMRRLAWGSLVAGLLMGYLISPFKTPLNTFPIYLKVITLLVSSIGIMIASELILIQKHLNNNLSKSTLFYFLNLLIFYPLIHRALPNLGLKAGQDLAFKTEHAWMEFIGPLGISKVLLMLMIYIKELYSSTLKPTLKLFFIYLFILLVLIMYY
uniref:NADH-ubiquinone oxidoreductase chain 5 n=1 Tax=Danionella mirifica TaxID=487619 RepID=F3Y706_9TELE|nr:NADH dehydrogenase subunit 5 [Danionella mirifica]